MLLPNYFEVTIENPDPKAIFDKLMTAPIGQNPCLLNLENIPMEELLNVMANIQAFLVNTKNSWSFPYPIFILAPLRFDQISIKQFLKKSSLPAFFANKSKRLNPKEVQIQQMNLLKTTKFKSIYNEEKVAHLRSLSPINQALKLEARKTEFYENLFEHLKLERDD
ncbi:MAG: hypothetical protein ACOYL6_07260 [Bacteriovoracaceae bacterium]